MTTLSILAPGAASIDVELVGSVTIGRHPSQVIVLRDRLVSKEHTFIEERSDGFYAIDLGSRSGTFVNDALIMDPRRLESGDTITIGDTRLLFTLTEDSVESLHTPPWQETT